MKKLLIISFIIFFFASCSENKENIYNYKIIDTTYVSKNGFDIIMGYDVIIKIDTTYYSASTDDVGRLTDVNRQLKIKNLK